MFQPLQSCITTTSKHLVGSELSFSQDVTLAAAFSTPTSEREEEEETSPS